MTIAGRIARVLQRHYSRVDRRPSVREVGEAAVVHLQHPSSMTMAEYIQRLIDFMFCSTECFVMAAAYAVRLATSDEVALNQFTIHRVYAGCLLLAVKTRDDRLYRMSYYSQVLGITTNEMRMMEFYLLKALDYRTFVSGDDYAGMVDTMLGVDKGTADEGWQRHLVDVPDRNEYSEGLASTQ